jgi:hypothetical protein
MFGTAPVAPNSSKIVDLRARFTKMVDPLNPDHENSGFEG